MKFNWPLNDNNFSWLDRLKIAAFFLNPSNRWTQGDLVKKYENDWKRYTSAKYVVMVSSGSTANTLIAEYCWDTNRNPNRNTIVFPAVTWQTSISPWIRLGFKPKFIDINLHDFSIDLKQLENYLQLEAGKVHTVFVTSLIGLTPDIPKLATICNKYGVELRLDNCENSFGEYVDGLENRHICSQFTCSTSNYFGHQTTNGGESGLIFTNSEDEFAYYIMNRSHGMVRTLLPYRDVLTPLFHEKFRNKDVDGQFDFATLGNNYRNTDIGAFMGLLDFARLDDYIEKREYLFQLFMTRLDKTKYLLPTSFLNRKHIGFCLPIISKKKDVNLIKGIRTFCDKNGIEHRPIISGNLLRQTCYKKYGDWNNFPAAEYLHQYGFYVGLYPKLKKEALNSFIDVLNLI